MLLLHVLLLLLPRVKHDSALYAYMLAVICDQVLKSRKPVWVREFAY